MAINLAARRRIATANTSLLRLARASDRTTRTAAAQALGATIQLADLPLLLDDALAESENQSVIQEAVRAACVRMPQSACASLLAERLTSAGDDQQAFLLDQLGVVGGEVALGAVVEAARSDEDSLQDAATKVLGEWLSADAAPALRELAVSLKGGKYGIRVLRGYIRIARQLDMPLADRMAVCRHTLELAERREEKTLVLEVIRRNPAVEGMQLAATLLEEPGLQEAACETIVAIAPKFAETAPAEVKQLLQRVHDTTGRVDIRAQASQLIKSVDAP